MSGVLQALGGKVKRITTATIAICIATAASPDGLRAIQHINCAAYAELRRLPLKRIEGASRANADADRVRDAHMAEALELGAPLVESNSGFPGLARPRSVGGSAAVRIGYFFGSVVTVEQDRFEGKHGVAPTSGRSLDARFEQLAHWYRIRATEMTSRYEVEGCADLF